MANQPSVCYYMEEYVSGDECIIVEPNQHVVLDFDNTWESDIDIRDIVVFDNLEEGENGWSRVVFRIPVIMNPREIKGIMYLREHNQVEISQYTQLPEEDYSKMSVEALEQFVEENEEWIRTDVEKNGPVSKKKCKARKEK